MSAAVDTRDQRDPAKLQARLEELRPDADPHYGGKATLAQVFEYGEKRGLLVTPDYDHGESTVTETTRKYREELEQRALKGDKYAISMLTTGEPGDSDE